MLIGACNPVVCLIHVSLGLGFDSRLQDHSIVVRTSVAGRAEINIASDSHAVCHRWAAALRAAIVPVTFDGWLQKKGERANSGWRYRWFELRGQKLIYFEAEGRAQKVRSPPRGGASTLTLLLQH